MGKHVIEDARRCIQCKVPKCREGCPVSTPIPDAIKMLLDGKIKEAGEMLFDNNPLSIICAMVCPHELQCEGHCILGKKSSPVYFSAIEHYISDYYLNVKKIKPQKNPNKKVAIIGSGPAGITISYMLAAKGYDVTIFEAYDQVGGVLYYGIPDFRLPKSFLERIKNMMLGYGIKIRPNTLIGPNLTVEELFRDGYKAIFIGTGTWKPNKTGLKGESLGNVHFAIDYLKNPDAYTLGDKVCVIGAGNVAMDVARTAIRKGVKEVYIMYRKGEDEITARKYETEYARLDGVNFEYFKTPVEFVDKGVIARKTKYITDAQGQKTLVDVEGSEELFESDSVILAISQGPRSLIISTTKGLNAAKGGLLKVDVAGKTTREGVFGSGDVVTGAQTVVLAVKHSKIVAEAIHDYVTRKYFPEEIIHPLMGTKV